jgi:hypothetical protein
VVNDLQIWEIKGDNSGEGQVANSQELSPT